MFLISFHFSLTVCSSEEKSLHRFRSGDDALCGGINHCDSSWSAVKLAVNNDLNYSNSCLLKYLLKCIKYFSNFLLSFLFIEIEKVCVFSGRRKTIVKINKNFVSVLLTSPQHFAFVESLTLWLHTIDPSDSKLNRSVFRSKFHKDSTKWHKILSVKNSCEKFHIAYEQVKLFLSFITINFHATFRNIIFTYWLITSLVTSCKHILQPCTVVAQS